MANEAKMQLDPADTVQHLRLSDILFDPDWNCRSIANAQEETYNEGDGQSTGMTGLVNSIGLKGQDQPVVVRVTNVPGFYRKTDKPYHLVDGARRFMAIQRINGDEQFVKAKLSEGKTAVPNTANGTIRAIVITADERGARDANGRYNGPRKQLDTADTMVWIGRMMQQKPPATAVEMAASSGLTVGWVQEMTRVLEGLDPAIFRHWREGGEFKHADVNEGKPLPAANRIPWDQLKEVSRVQKDRQPEQYATFLIGKRENAGNKEWLNAGIKQAAKAGTMLARLVKEEVIELSGKDWIDCVPFLVRMHKKAKADDATGRNARKKYAKAVRDAYDAEMRRDDTKKGGGEDEGEEEAAQ